MLPIANTVSGAFIGHNNTPLRHNTFSKNIHAVNNRDPRSDSASITIAEHEPMLLSYWDQKQHDEKAYSIDEVLGEGVHIANMVKEMNEPVQARTKRFTKCQIVASLCAVIGVSVFGIGATACRQYNYCNDIFDLNSMRQSTPDFLAKTLAAMSVSSEKRILLSEDGFEREIKDQPVFGRLVMDAPSETTELPTYISDRNPMSSSKGAFEKLRQHIRKEQPISKSKGAFDQLRKRMMQDRPISKQLEMGVSAETPKLSVCI